MAFTLNNIYGLTFDARHEWRSIFVALGLSSATINSIGMQWRDRPEDCLREGLEVWLRGDGRDWACIIEALSTVGHRALAEKLRKDVGVVPQSDGQKTSGPPIVRTREEFNCPVDQQPQPIKPQFQKPQFQKPQPQFQRPQFQQPQPIQSQPHIQQPQVPNNSRPLNRQHSKESGNLYSGCCEECTCSDLIGCLCSDWSCDCDGNWNCLNCFIACVDCHI